MRFLATKPTGAVRYPQNSPLNSFVKKTLPVILMGRRACAEISLSLRKQNAYKVGEGCLITGRLSNSEPNALQVLAIASNTAPTKKKNRAVTPTRIGNAKNVRFQPAPTRAWDGLDGS